MLNPQSIPSTQLHQVLGARQVAESRSRFCVWSPTSQTVHIKLLDSDRTVAMHKVSGGYYVAELDGVRAGDRYFYQFDDGPDLPDPASRYQVEGVHGPSVVAGDAFAWTDQGWRGLQPNELIVYELHIGALTDRGTFTSAIERLDELVDLGINAIELMPVADTAGRWNWGYDGVCLFAPNRNYGTPDDLRRLVDAAHSKGLAVIVDVVYNHLGPEGNYLGQSGPYLSAHHYTIWGSAPNFDDPTHSRELRRFFVANAIHWFDEFHLDGLRVDAIHCMFDHSDRHIVMEIGEAVQSWSTEFDRPAMLIAESNVYDANMLAPLAEGGCGYHAEWCDDFLHSLFAVVRPGDRLSHRSYEPNVDLDQVLRMGYVYSGSLYHERGRQPLRHRIDTSGLVYCIQNHDFIGNHPLGKRLHQLTSRDTQRAAAALMILSPAIPMLFMGEEFACEQPFQFFVDYSDDHLRQAVVAGRKREYPQHDWSGSPSPIEPEAFQRSKIGPAEAGDQSMRRWYRSLIELRKQWQSRGLLSCRNVSVESDLQSGLFVLRYQHHGETATVAVRLHAHGSSQSPIAFPAAGQQLLDSRDDPNAEGQLLANHAKVFSDSR